MILGVVLFYTVRAPRLRLSQRLGDRDVADSLPMWLTRITPVVLAANVALLLAASLMGHWMAVVYAAISVGWGFITLLTKHRVVSDWKSQPPLNASTPPPGWSQPSDWDPVDSRPGQQADLK